MKMNKTSGERERGRVGEDNANILYVGLCAHAGIQAYLPTALLPCRKIPASRTHRHTSVKTHLKHEAEMLILTGLQ